MSEASVSIPMEYDYARKALGEALRLGDEDAAEVLGEMRKRELG